MPPIESPLVSISENGVQVASGTAVFPKRAPNESPVPGGSCAVHSAVLHTTSVPASRTREVKVPDEA